MHCDCAARPAHLSVQAMLARERDGETAMTRAMSPRSVSRCGSLGSILLAAFLGKLGSRGGGFVRVPPLGLKRHFFRHWLGCPWSVRTSLFQLPTIHHISLAVDDFEPHQHQLEACSFPQSQPGGATAHRPRPQPRAPMAGRRSRCCALSAHRWRKGLCRCVWASR